jgi:hypothetical protein
VEQSSTTDQSSQDGPEAPIQQESEPLKPLPDFDSNPNLLKLDYDLDYMFMTGAGEGISDFLS